MDKERLTRREFLKLAGAGVLLPSFIPLENPRPTPEFSSISEPLAISRETQPHTVFSLETDSNESENSRLEQTNFKKPELTETSDVRLDSERVRDMFFQETAGGIAYVVQRGDTLFGIAEKFFDSNLNTLLDLNPDYESNPDLIYAGNLIVLPQDLEIGGISFWSSKPRLNNKWIYPGEADPPVKWKDIVIYVWNPNDPSSQPGSKEYPFVVVTVGRRLTQ